MEPIWRWGDPIEYGFNWQNPKNYVQFMDALWERWLATGLSGYPGVTFGTEIWFSTPDFAANPWSVPTHMSLIPNLYYKDSDPTSIPVAVNLQNQSTTLRISGSDIKSFNPGPPEEPAWTRHWKPGFNYKGIGELEWLGYVLLTANYLHSSKVDDFLDTNPLSAFPAATGILRAPYSGFGGHFDPQLYLGNNFQVDTTPETSGSRIAALLGQRTYPRRRRPREIKGVTGSEDITGEHGNSANSTLAPVGAIAYKYISAGSGVNITESGFLTEGFYQHTGGGTWTKMSKVDGVAADTMDSDYPTDHANYISPDLMQWGDYIDHFKFRELYNLCRLLKYTGFRPQLTDYVTQNTVGAWSPTGFTGRLGLPETLAIPPTRLINSKWGLNFPLMWKGLASQAKFYVCAASVPGSVFDDNGGGFRENRWNLWATINSTRGAPTFSSLDSGRQWNAAGDPPSTANMVPPHGAGFSILDLMLIMKWDVTGGFQYL